MQNSLLYELLDKKIGTIRTAETYHFFYLAMFSMSHLLLYLLQITGKAHVTITSFAFSELACNNLFYAKKQDLMYSCRCMFDFTMKRRNLHLLYSADNVVDEIYLNRNHSKIILIENENWKLVVNGSANFTKNERFEACVIDTRPDVYDNYKQEIDLAFEKSIKYGRRTKI